MHLALFIIFAALCVAGALNLLLQRHPINSALSLIVVMSSLAVLYLLLGAEFLAAAQVIVYSGAIMVLFTFVIMLLNAGREERTHGSKLAYIVGISRRSRAPRPAGASSFSRTRATFGAGAARRIPGDHQRPEPRALPRPAAALRSHLGPDSHRHSGRSRAGAKGALSRWSRSRTTSSSAPSSSPSGSPRFSSSATSSPSSCRLS